MNGELILGISLGTAFATLISFGYGRRMTQDETGRVLLGMAGFTIALGTYSMYRHDFALFMEIGGWFLACLAPVLIGGVVSNMLAKKRDEDAYAAWRQRNAEEHQAELATMRAAYEEKLTKERMARYSVTGVDRDTA